MEREQFIAQLGAISHSPIRKGMVRIVFADGESHVAQAWTILVNDYLRVGYLDVHMDIADSRIWMPYENIARVEPYEQRKQSS